MPLISILLSIVFQSMDSDKAVTLHLYYLENSLIQKASIGTV